MFSLEQIQAAHAQVKSGADFPRYVQDLIRLGVSYYQVNVANGQADYFGKGDEKISSLPKYDSLAVADQGDAEAFKRALKEHQQGKTDYLAFCGDCAEFGVEKWVVRMDKMTCVYFDKAGNELFSEEIPG